jgi:SM-20-related protein
MGISLTQNLDQLVDGLADQGYAIIDNFLSAEEVDAILQLDEFNGELLKFQRAAIGKKEEKQINESIRGDYIQWINRGTAAPAIQVYLTKLNDLIKQVNQNLFLSLKDYEIHMTVYPIGSYYHRHLDQFKRDDHRKLSVICYLNKNWQEAEGGQLKIYTNEDSFSILPIVGRLVCFRSDLLEHEVLPATRNRLSLTGWILDQHSDLRHL